MKVEIVYRNDTDRPLNDPLPESNRLVFRLVRGDYCDPINGQWFGPEWPTRVLRHYFKYVPIPFVAWYLWGWKGYIGAKIYNVHHDQYKNWLPPEEVYPESQAFCLSFRFRATS